MNEALARKCALEAFPPQGLPQEGYDSDWNRQLREQCVAAILSYAEQAEGQRDKEWLAFMESRMWDGAVAISKRDFLKLPAPPQEKA